jgi:hypothetical protein
VPVRWLLLAMLVGCKFAPGERPVDAAPVPDSLRGGPCPEDPHLRLCFSFDQPTLDAMLPNEGAAPFSAKLGNVTRTTRGAGGAAVVGIGSEILVPSTDQVTGIRTMEISARIDRDPADQLRARAGLIDSANNPSISIFYYTNVAPARNYLRCGLGPAFVFSPAVTLVYGDWIGIACTCDEAGMQRMYFDGVLVASAPGCDTGAIIASGLTIGQNNVDGTDPIDDFFTGGVDNVRLWDSVRTAEELAKEW